MRRNLFFIVLLGLYAGAQLPAPVSLQGTVFSGNTTERLAGASITLYYQGTVTGLVANQEGRFTIPSTHLFDSLKISMIGHHSKLFKAVEFENRSAVEIRLEVVAASMQPVVLKPVTAVELIKRIIAKLPVNQPQSDFEDRGFYREIIRDRDHFFSVAEAVFTAQYSPAGKKSRLRLEQGRSKEDVSYTRLFEDFHPGGGPQAVAGNSFITGQPAFLTFKEMNNFKYKIDSMVRFDDHWLYRISFDQKQGVKEALDKGYLLVDPEDDAVVSYDVVNSPMGTPYIKNLTGTEKIMAEMMHIDYRRKGWKRHVDFTKLKDKWLMSYTAQEFTISYKQPKKQLDLDLTISIELMYTDFGLPVEKQIVKGEEWKRQNIIANLPAAFDSSFWGGRNILAPTTQLEMIITSISKANGDTGRVFTNGGWEYLNRNYFVSYSRADTLSLLPVMPCNWEDELSGGFLYRGVDSNFFYETKINLRKNSDRTELPDRGFQQAGLLLRSDKGDKENYVFLSMGTGGNSKPKIFFKKTTESKSKTVMEKCESLAGWLRIEKAGKLIRASYKKGDGDSYELLGEYELDWLAGKLQLGLAVFATFAGSGPKMKPDLLADFTNIHFQKL